MTTVSILPVPSDDGGQLYQAVAGDQNVCGSTPGEALDAITAQLEFTDASTLVVLQNHLPDRFFTAEQIDRLNALMAHWREARDNGKALPANEQAELDALVQAELRAAGQRAGA